MAPNGRSLPFGIRFDLRVPDAANTDHVQQYSACIEMCRWAERLGFRSVLLSEHHGTPDGYLPAPLALAGVILGATGRIRVTIGAALLPLHDPVRLAEQLAVLDLAAPGRIGIIAGAGYREEEFAMAGVSLAERGRLLEQSVDVMRRAWSGEPFDWRGRRIVVRPRPATKGGPWMAIGGSTPAAARRAARLRCPFAAAIDDPKLRALYEQSCSEQGYTDGVMTAPSGPAFTMISEDPEATWAKIGDYAVFDAQTYDQWQQGRQQRSAVVVENATTVEDVRASGLYCVLTPDEAIETIRDIGSLVLHPLMGGIPPELAWQGLDLFETKVLPELHDERGAEAGSSR